MKTFSNLLFWSLCIVFLFGVAPLVSGGELIQPTRTLQSPEKLTGKISVFSEPPGLDVFLNHSKIGKTPILSMEVKAGKYKLEVQNATTEIYVIPDKSLRLSLFKSKFITVKESKIEKIQNPEAGTLRRKLTEPKEEESYQPKYDPAYWPLKPNGPIE
jgi:hypothetical protein